jgi:hypothetical protein
VITIIKEGMTLAENVAYMNRILMLNLEGKRSLRRRIYNWWKILKLILERDDGGPPL